MVVQRDASDIARVCMSFHVSPFTTPLGALSRSGPVEFRVRTSSLSSSDWVSHMTGQKQSLDRTRAAHSWQTWARTCVFWIVHSVSVNVELRILVRISIGMFWMEQVGRCGLAISGSLQRDELKSRLNEAEGRREPRRFGNPADILIDSRQRELHLRISP